MSAIISPNLMITPDNITLAACEKIKADLYQAWQESCEMVAFVHNSMITTEDAAELANAILAPFQLFPERGDDRKPQSRCSSLQKRAGGDQPKQTERQKR